jgi:hypothetical protein
MLSSQGSHMRFLMAIPIFSVRCLARKLSRSAFARVVAKTTRSSADERNGCVPVALGQLAFLICLFPRARLVFASGGRPRT